MYFPAKQGDYKGNVYSITIDQKAAVNKDTQKK